MLKIYKENMRISQTFYAIYLLKMWLNLQTFYSVCKMCVSVHVYRYCNLQGRYKDLLRFYQLNGSSFQCMSMKCSGVFSPVRVTRESLNELPMQILLVCFKDLLLTSLFFSLSLQEIAWWCYCKRLVLKLSIHKL